MQMTSEDNDIKFWKKVTIICATSAILLLTLFVNKSFRHKELRNSVKDLQYTVCDLHASVSEDVLRRGTIRKVVDIIRTVRPEVEPIVAHKIAEEIYHQCNLYEEINVDLVCAVIFIESRWNTGAISKKKDEDGNEIIVGARGLMQIMPVTGMYVAQVLNIAWQNESILFDPIYNLRMGCRILADNVKAYGLEGGLVAYNAGEKYAPIWVQSAGKSKYIPNETRDYVPSVLNKLENIRTSSS
jgi:hypothetical protein